MALTFLQRIWCLMSPYPGHSFASLKRSQPTSEAKHKTQGMTSSTFREGLGGCLSTHVAKSKSKTCLLMVPKKGQSIRCGTSSVFCFFIHTGFGVKW